MNHSLIQPRRILTIPRVFGIFAWAGLLYAALAIAHLPGDWGHSICGAWGCGPPLQAIVGCQLAWLVVLGTSVLALDRYAATAVHSRRLLSWSLMFGSLASILAIIAYQRFTWWAEAGEWQQQFFWQRCGFVILTTTDLPLIQSFFCGLFLRIRATGKPQGSP